MRFVPYEFVQSLAAEFGAVECFWRESERSFTGFVAEVWFELLPSEFAARCRRGLLGLRCLSWWCGAPVWWLARWPDSGSAGALGRWRRPSGCRFFVLMATHFSLQLVKLPFFV